MRFQEVYDAIEAWQLRRRSLAATFSKDGMREFVETHNAMTRKLISAFGTTDPEFYSSLLELSQNASTMTAGGKLFADKKDVTNL